MKRYPAIFLDRDGTLIRERGYLSDPQKIHFYHHVAKALRLLSLAGFKLVIVSNQSGIARGYFSMKRLKFIHAVIANWLKKRGGKIDGIYVCPHMPDGRCPCRKPKPRLVFQAVRDLKLDLRRSYVIGDQDRDFQLAFRVGAQPVHLLTGWGRLHQKAARRKNVKVAGNILSAARWILRQNEISYDARKSRT